MKTFREFTGKIRTTNSTDYQDDVIDFLISTGILGDEEEVELNEKRKGLSSNQIKGISLFLKNKLMSVSSRVKNEKKPDKKLDLLSQQMNIVGGLSLLSVAATGDNSSLLSKISTVASLRN